MKKTEISWTDYSWNPWQGCKKISPACDNCYMFSDKKRYGQNGSDIYRSTKQTFNKPLKIKESVKVFTCSWSDFFLVEADEWRNEAWDVIRATSHLTYQILTKRPENIKDRLPKDWEENFGHVWLGVTAENQEEANKRIPILLDTPASKRFVSIEPLIEEIDLHNIEEPKHSYFSSLLDYDPRRDFNNTLDWVIVGGESGAKTKVREMNPEWVQTIYEDCKDNGVPFFFKQWGSHKPNEKYEFENVQEFPKDKI